MINRSKIPKVMREYHHGTLRSGSGQKVTDRKQALAIAMSEARRNRYADGGMVDYNDPSSPYYQDPAYVPGTVAYTNRIQQENRAQQAFDEMNQEQRLAAAQARAAAGGSPVDWAKDIWGWNPEGVDQSRRDYGYTWIPGYDQAPIPVAPGLSVPGMPDYDPAAPPAGSLAVPGSGAQSLPGYGVRNPFLVNQAAQPTAGGPAAGPTASALNNFATAAANPMGNPMQAAIQAWLASQGLKPTSGIPPGALPHPTAQPSRPPNTAPPQGTGPNYSASPLRPGNLSPISAQLTGGGVRSLSYMPPSPVNQGFSLPSGMRFVNVPGIGIVPRAQTPMRATAPITA